jgi:hypothetical protein
MMTVFAGCASAAVDQSEQARIESRDESRPEKGGISRAELQDALFRFESGFSEDLRQALQPLAQDKKPTIRDQALTNRLVYVSSAMSIALGPITEANLLDMVVFVELSRAAFKEYWLPKVYGAKGRPAARAFDRAQDDVWKIASMVLTPEQGQVLRDVIGKWRADHPGQYAVEAIRLSEVAATAGARARGVDKQVSGLLSDVKKATFAADQALLFGERALYYAQRAPFLFRMQGRAAVSELMGAFSEATSALPAVDAAVRDGTVLAKEVRQLAALVLDHRTPEFSRLRNEAINGAVRILEEYNRTLASPAHAQNMERLQGMGDRVEASMDRILTKAVIAIVVVIGFAAFAITLSRMAYLRWATRRRPQAADSDAEPPAKRAA